MSNSQVERLSDLVSRYRELESHPDRSWEDCEAKERALERLNDLAEEVIAAIYGQNSSKDKEFRQRACIGIKFEKQIEKAEHVRTRISARRGMLEAWINLLDWGLEEVGSRSAIEPFAIGENLFPEDVSSSVNLTLTEIFKSFDNECFLASIALCGRVIETVLHNLLLVSCGIDADKERLGFDAIRSRLRKAGYPMEDSIDHQFKLIASHRNKAVHGNVLFPTKEEAQAVILLTRGVIARATTMPNRSKS